jgi:hypothetical protein
MPLAVQCFRCNKRYQVADEFSGKKVKCQCGETLSVPAAAQGALPWDDDDLLPSRPTAPQGAPQPVCHASSPKSRA